MFMKKRHLLFSRKQEKQLEEYQRDLIETHFQEVNAMYRQIRGWRHDYRNHIQTMKAYAADQNWDALVAYLNLLDTDLHTVDLAVKTGNAMTDAILNSKISLAKSKDIPLRAEASIPYELKIPELDLCVIIGNLLDNAIEASLTLPKEKRMIRLYMDMKGPQLYISCTNFFAGKKKPRIHGRFATTKGHGHGLGLVRMDDAVEKLGGYLTRNSEDGAFTTEILLPQQLD
jgi:sensor histidine kinase regulating citrate/malate metabolism